MSYSPVSQSSLQSNSQIIMSSSVDHPVAENAAAPTEDYDTPLRKHVAFFDRNGDGLVYPTETFQGFRAIGCGILISLAGAMVINPAFSRRTRPGGKFNILFPIGVNDIKFAIHRSDTGVFNKEGKFDPNNFEKIFAKHAKTNSEALTKDELSEMLKANKEPKDIPGQFAAFTEWKLLFSLCKDKNGLLHKETIKSFYDGNLFYKMEAERKNKKIP